MGKKTTPVTDRNREIYGDSDFTGNGTLLCYLCGLPTKDHPLAQPCPFDHNPIPLPDGLTKGRRRRNAPNRQRRR